MTLVDIAASNRAVLPSGPGQWQKLAKAGAVCQIKNAALEASMDRQIMRQERKVVILMTTDVHDLERETDKIYPGNTKSPVKEG